MNKKIEEFTQFIKLQLKQNKNNNFKKNKAIINNVKMWFMLLFGISIIIYLITNISIAEFVNFFLKVNIVLFIIAIITGLTATVIRTLRFEYYFPSNGRILSLYGIFAIMRVFYYVLPFNTGEVVYLTVLKKYRFITSITETAPTWLFLRITDIIALSMWLIIVIFFIPFSGNLFSEFYPYRWFLILVLGLFLLTIVSLPLWIPKIKFSNNSKWITQKILTLQDGFKRTFGLFSLFRTLFLSILIWFVLILFDTLILVSFNTPLSFIECFLASIAIYCISLLPINAPLNLGTDEALWSGILILAGVSTSIAISISLSIRIVNIIILSIEGILGFSVTFAAKNK